MSIAPLPTTFTPASSCLGDNNIWQIFFESDLYYFMQGPPSDLNLGCLPPSYGDSEYTFYYPGICPSGYTAACTSVKSLGTYTATVQICCPTRLVFPLPSTFRNYSMFTNCQFCQRLPMSVHFELSMASDSGLLHSTQGWNYFCGCVFNRYYHAWHRRGKYYRCCECLCNCYSNTWPHC
jgi:hypothetical protein